MTESRDSVTMKHQKRSNLILTKPCVDAICRMAKTAAERQRERRQRLRLNKEELKLYQEKDNERKKKARISLNSADLKHFRNKGKLATRRWRVKLASAVLNNADSTPSSTGQKTDIYPYSTPASFGKAKRRVEKCLPRSPRKRSAVLARLAEGLNAIHVAKAAPSSMDPAIKATAVEFYCNDSISRMMPGKADYVSLRRDDGTKEKVQKRHLVMTVGEVYKEFKREHEKFQIGKSTFASLRPKHVLLNSQMPHNVCGCKYHNNMLLLVECLHKTTGTSCEFTTSQFRVSLRMRKKLLEMLA